MENNDDRNFVDFIKEYNINIPIIQRDYVQGRKNEEYIRNNFIDAIFDSLLFNKKLSLDFIYGNIREKTFEPIDGQQRLTTLYLVTLFLALREGKKEEFKEIKPLTYSVRNSSEEFCKKLKENLQSIPDNIKNYIVSQKWYDDDWKKDQTIESMLVMLQTIQDKYKEKLGEETKIELYNILEKNVSFKFINTEDEELDDDTYIKLNARGKVLSSFENYKSAFLEFKNFREKYYKKVDNTWNDWIWKKIDIEDYKKDNSIFDKAFAGIFKAILTNEYIKNHKMYNIKDENYKNLEYLITKDIIDFSKYKDLLGDKIEEAILNLGKIFEFFIKAEIEKEELNKYIDANELINNQLILPKDKNNKENERYNKLKGNIERCEFFAICLYAIENYDKNEFNKENYLEWTRIARNLISRDIRSDVEHTVYINNLDNLYQELIKTNKNSENYIEALSKIDKHIYEINNEDKSFDKEFKDKLKQEVEKANVMLINEKWKEIIEENDENKFLAGETKFLLDFCGILEHNNNETECFEKYKKYTQIKNIIFTKDGVLYGIDNEFLKNQNDTNDYKLLSRALFALSARKYTNKYLTKSEQKSISNIKYGYLLETRGEHFSFISSLNNYRDYRWRNFFEQKNKEKHLYFKILMDIMMEKQVQNEIQIKKELQDIINSSYIDIKNNENINTDYIYNWKKYFIKNDNVFRLLNSNINMIKIEENKKMQNIFLLNTKTDNGYSLPLFFIAIQEKAEQKGIEMSSKNKKLNEAWTTGLRINFEDKKRIDKINGKDAIISMKRDDNGNICYYKKLSELEQNEKDDVNEILSEVEKEFSIKFEDKV